MTEIRDQRVVILMSKDEADAIEEWMHANRIKSRSAAIRRLCQLAFRKEGDMNAWLDHMKSIQQNILKDMHEFTIDIDPGKISPEEFREYMQNTGPLEDDE